MTDQGPRALIVDDEPEIRAILARLLATRDIASTQACSGEEAMCLFREVHPDLVLLDIKMPGIGGMEALRQMKESDPDIPVVLVTAHAYVPQAVEAMRDGAHDYVAKPFDNCEIVRVAERAIGERELKRRLRNLSINLHAHESLAEVMGFSDTISRLVRDIERVAKSEFTVVIIGETGSGKELVAETIHGLSPRCDNAFISVDCGAIPENLVESELFGHERGSYTGADCLTRGKIEVAHKGTVFMDEISNMSLGSQAKVLRAIQDRKICRVGGTKSIDVDVRLIAASNQDLQTLVAKGLFRKDLFYRLNEFSLTVPPLRERRDDIVFLAKRFLDRANVDLHKNVAGLTAGAVEKLLTYSWPGNVRQLKSVIRRATLLARDSVTEKELDLDEQLGANAGLVAAEHHISWRGLPLREILRQSMATIERDVITEALRLTGGNKAQAARLLQVDYKTIHTKVKKLNISIGGNADRESRAE